MCCALDRRRRATLKTIITAPSGSLPLKSIWCWNKKVVAHVCCWNILADLASPILHTLPCGVEWWCWWCPDTTKKKEVQMHANNNGAADVSVGAPILLHTSALCLHCTGHNSKVLQSNQNHFKALQSNQRHSKALKSTKKHWTSVHTSPKLWHVLM